VNRFTASDAPGIVSLAFDHFPSSPACKERRRPWEGEQTQARRLTLYPQGHNEGLKGCGVIITERAGLLPRGELTIILKVPLVVIVPSLKSFLVLSTSGETV
jgi:hypothetical protein